MAADALAVYRKEIERELKGGDATEHTHRPALKKLVESLGEKILAKNEPKRSKAGAPDYIVCREAKHGPLTLGYIEAKDIGKNLNEIEKDEQLARYRTLPNLILTDYLEFRWYVDGKPHLTASLGALKKSGKVEWAASGGEQVLDLLRAFLEHEIPAVSNPKDLAQRMASLAKNIRPVIVGAFETKQASKTLKELKDGFEKALIPDLKAEDFGDMFAQTIAYGLFAAAANHFQLHPGKHFQRLGAAAEIPKTNPLLRDLFNFIAGPDLEEEPYAGLVEDLAQLLADTDMEAVLADFGKRTKQEDPIVHFYETFLAAYNPKLRESRGVYYTPEPVVSYIVRSVDYLLKERFGLKDGLADTSMIEYPRRTGSGKSKKEGKATSHKVLILDPACGTGTFLYRVVDEVRSRFMEKGNAGMWSAYVREHLLPRLFGFELLMAPYAVAHLKLGMQLAGQDLDPPLRKKWAYDFEKDDRVRVFLTNTLDEAERRAQYEMGWGKRLTDESNAAVEIKSELPIMVVMGNPPYSGHSVNSSWIIEDGKKTPTFIGRILQDYFHVDGKPLGERNSKWLQDDYVKFIRFGQWRIERTGAGVLAFITNHAYLENPTFRGMRQQLMKNFSEIYILDLHGNAKRKETTPSGGKDENVFDIQQGVAIGIFVKLPSHAAPAKVFHWNLWGMRNKKYETLSSTSMEDAHWVELTPSEPHYLFTKHKDARSEEYADYTGLTQLFIHGNMGITTGKDEFAASHSHDELESRLGELVGSTGDSELIVKYGLQDSSSFSLAAARAWARKTKSPNTIVNTSYRCFDEKFVIYSSFILARPREDICHHLIGRENLAIASFRAIRELPWQHAFVSRLPVIKEFISSLDNCFAYPLYAYPNGELFDRSPWPASKKGRRPNLDFPTIADWRDKLGYGEFVSDGTGDLKKTFGPEDVFHYIYAIFHSPTYRKRYAEFLKIDFPRVPLTSDTKLFAKLCKLGEELVALHLLDKTGPKQPKFPEKGGNEVEKVRYTEPGQGAKQGRVWINAEQYFDGVSPEVWEFHVGGYQVCEKWLKDRKGRKLSHEDLTHYAAVAANLGETIRLMKEIDEAIPKWPIK